MIAPLTSPSALKKQVRRQSEVAIHEDFRKARRRAFWRQFLNQIRSRPNRLPAMDQILSGCSRRTQLDLGHQIVPIDSIVGSVGRSQDFDDRFLPRHEHLKDRWINVNRAYHNDVSLPLVELMQVGDRYFVADGHHRISVARLHKQSFVDAHVVKIAAACSGGD
jgi:hypothetical protein